MKALGKVWRATMACGLVLAAATSAESQPYGSMMRAYVANRGAASMSVIDVEAGTVIATIPLEASPHDVVIVAGLVYVSMPAVNRVAIVDPLKLAVSGVVQLPGQPRDLEIDPTSPYALFIATIDGVHVWNSQARTLAAAIPVGPGLGKVVEASRYVFDHIYVAACDGGPEVRLLTRSTGAVSAPVATGVGPCAVHADPTAVYVANTAGNSISVLTPTLESPITVPVAPQPVGLAPGAAGIWVVSASGTLTLLDRATHGVATTYAIGGSPSAIGTTGGELLNESDLTVVTDSGANTLRVFSSTGALLRTVPTGVQPGAFALGFNRVSEPISVTTGGDWGDFSSRDASMSLDARFVAFTSDATNLVAGDTNGAPDVFVRDRLLRQTVRVSVSSAGAEGINGPVHLGVSGSFTPRISGDGRFVAFVSAAANLVVGDDNGRYDVFLHDRDVDADGLFDEPNQISTRRISVRNDGTPAPCAASSGAPCFAVTPEMTISADGRQVVYSTLLELDPADTNQTQDVYAYDVTRGRTTRLSVRAGGGQTAATSTLPVTNATGRIVAFATMDALVSYDTNGLQDVFAVDRDPDGNGVFDEQSPTLTHISLRPGGALFTSFCFPVAVSDDGRWVAYSTNATLGIYDRSSGHNSLLYEGTALISGLGRFSSDARSLALSTFNVSPGLTMLDRDTDVDGVFDEVGAFAFTTLPEFFGTLAADALLRSFVVSSESVPTGLGLRDLVDPLHPPFDTDADGLGNSFEAGFGLGASSATGDNGPDGDPDADGFTNAQEQRAGTHPRGFATRYLAEGATGAFFSTRIAVANPGTTAASVLLRYQTDTGQTTSTLMPVPGRARGFVDLGSVASLASANVSTVIESDAPVVVDRTMFWSAGFYGSHAETSLPNPSTTWFLAEGATHGAFDLFYLLQNPSATSAAQVDVRFLRTSGAPIVRTYTVPAARRLTIYVDEVAGLEAADVSAAFTSTNAVPIIVERAMYYSGGGTAFTAGHGSAGVTAPTERWFLAEGATGGYFDLFVLLANPSDTDAQVRLTYLRPIGAPIVKTRTLPANSRQTNYVASEDALLVDTPVSTIVETTNGVGIVVERAMWWPAVGGWQEAHNAPGATAAATRWGFADGEVGGPPYNAQTYFLIANSGPEAATVRVMLLFDDGTAPVEKTYVVSANSRFNVPAGSEFPAAAGKGFGALIESLGATPVPIVVERAMYSDAVGVTWAAGTDALGTPLPVP